MKKSYHSLSQNKEKKWATEMMKRQKGVFILPVLQFLIVLILILSYLVALYG